uniref:uncharacterized protein LOC120327255 n=1 Tax=Styela clava TaxID=7725 RepID=UPI001939EB9B|nr:uncharacterized protein LOC120327255 [Styela clava]
MENDGMSVDATYFIGEEISELIEIKLPENKRSRKRKRSREMPNSILKRPKLSVHLHDTKICAENNIQDRARVRIRKKHCSVIVQQKLSRPQDKSKSETSCEEMEND